ncbi:MAG: proprotein convertase P-domain-containing protein, partial [Planctomycetes bacterium]|nr:proprotein convertase P-domain-containing protein [Planctomycetota bacterium]
MTHLKIAQTGTVPIQAAEITNEASGEFVIPGGLGQKTGFAAFFNEFFVVPEKIEEIEGDPDATPPIPYVPPRIDYTTGPFTGDDPPKNTRGRFLSISGPDKMAVEWVEVQLDITGDANAIDFLRITLVSPDGTHSDLTNYQYRPATFENSFQAQRGTASSGDLYADPPGELFTGPTFSWTYSTNRHWGERSEGRWELHFENYSEAALSLDGARVVFHGRAIGTPRGPSGRVSGKIGVDSGRESYGHLYGARDGDFNFTRQISGYPDALQEPFASNVTVVAIDNDSGFGIAQFVTGADGNFYFDLPDNNSGYTIEIQDPLGRTALNDPFGDYHNSWQVYGPMSDVNFLLDPGQLPVNEVVFKGQVFADLDGDGTQDPVDIGMPDFQVFADLNHTGLWEAGEPIAISNAAGNYELLIPAFSPSAFSTVVITPTGWTRTYPASGFNTEYAQLGETVEDVDFGVKPPSQPTGSGDGILFGFVFVDENGDGIQQSYEVGFAGKKVFIDAGAMNGVFDTGEVYTFTGETGAFLFSNVTPGTVRVDAVVNLPYVMTTPEAGYRDVTVGAGQVVQNIVFGIRNMAIDDFGDLDGFMATTSAENGARHFVVPGFSLGALVDSELDAPNPPQNGMGDDLTGIDDEDGVSVMGGVLHPGANTLEVTLNGVGGYLNGWIDFNDNQVWEPTEQVFTNLDLNPGTYQLLVEAPALGGIPVAARFRWGTPNLSFTGAAPLGEVEDYLFDTAAAALELPAGDYNGDLIVNTADFDLWKSTFGSSSIGSTAFRSTADLRADGNGDGVVDSADYTVWKDNEGAVYASGAGSGAMASAAIIDDSTGSPDASSLADIAIEHSLRAWEARHGSTGAMSASYLEWLERIGATRVTYNGPNGPQTRFAYTPASASNAPSYIGMEEPLALDLPIDGNPVWGPVAKEAAFRGWDGLQFSVAVSSQVDPVVQSPESAVISPAAAEADLLILD